MSDGFTSVATLAQMTTHPVFAQFGGQRSYYVDLIIIAAMFALVLFVVGRASRRY